MRFASIVTLAAAVAAAPVVATATGPQMASEDFVSAVRCAAYETLPQFEGENPALAQTRRALNAEARHQPAAVAAAAQAEVSAVARQGASAETVSDAQALRRARAAACSGSALVADRAGAAGEV